MDQTTSPLSNDMTKAFFRKTLGKWESHRTYMYKNGKTTYSVTEFDWKEEEGGYTVNWVNEILKSSGSMHLKIANDFELHRSIGYFSKEATVSRIIAADNKTLHTITTYGGHTYDEKIEFVTDDLRIRRTIAYKEGKPDEVFLIGNYVERRLCPRDRAEAVAELEGLLDLEVE